MAYDADTDVPDEALLVLYANGDRHAALALTRRITPRVMGYAARMLGGDRAEAEDVAQETMLRLWRMAPEWRQGETKVTTWAYRVATNLCIDRQRSRGRKRQMALDDAPEVADGTPGPRGSCRKPTGWRRSRRPWPNFRSVSGRRWCCATWKG